MLRPSVLDTHPSAMEPKHSTLKPKKLSVKDKIGVGAMSTVPEKLALNDAKKARQERHRAHGFKLSRKGKENLAGYLFLLPWLVGLFALTGGPVIASLYFSFTNFDLL